MVVYFPRENLEYLQLLLHIQINICKKFPKQSQTNLKFLSYLHKYGYNDAMEKLVEDEVLITPISFVNALHKMRKQGIVIGKNYKFRGEKPEITKELITNFNEKVETEATNFSKTPMIV